MIIPNALFFSSDEWNKLAAIINKWPSLPDPTAQAVPQADYRAMEDKIKATVDAFSDLEAATAYLYIAHAKGMTLQKAISLRQKAGITS